MSDKEIFDFFQKRDNLEKTKGLSMAMHTVEKELATRFGKNAYVVITADECKSVDKQEFKKFRKEPSDELQFAACMEDSFITVIYCTK